MHFFEVFKNKLIAFFDNQFLKRTQFSGDPNLLDENYGVNSKNAPTFLTKNLIDFANLNEDEVFLKLDSNRHGLSNVAVDIKQHKFGLNQIEQEKKLTWYKHLFLSYRNPFNLLLTLLATISYLTDDMKATIVIGSMVVVSTVLRFVQERRSNNAADKLKAMVSTTATVFRYDANKKEEILKHERNVRLNLHLNSHTKEVPIKELVPGDILALSAGDMIPADIRILSAKDLFVSQAALTGESLPIEKFNKCSNSNISDVSQLENIGFMGTNVVSGAATAIVIAIGKKTLFGALADKIIHQDAVETSFQKGINRVSWLLIYFMMVMAPIVLLINGITKHDWVSAALFAIAIAVGLTPEMLPMIVTSTLAKGAVAMSRRKVIVKRLDAIQNFGAMDILCTDKTGTLTQDKICLEKHTDIYGEDFDDVLEYAYLNSYYQTGLKNLLDIAVLDRANFGDIPELVTKFKKVDEVPFDFQRRMMSVVVARNEKEHVLICKGAVEELLRRCNYAHHKDAVLPLTKELLAKVKEVTAELNSNGLRIVAVAVKKYQEAKTSYTIDDEYDMVLVGYIAFMDPPKETTAPAIAALHKNGVAVKVLTGDNELVAAKVCREVGLNIEGMLLGTNIDYLTDTELAKIAENTTVFAKLTPFHKERIVKVLREKGHVVGFMGDGINDAPALRIADIGISVDTAVDIAKEAADIILLEKSLMVLENGIVEGRKTFANMQKYVKMTASSNFGNVFSVLVASAFLPFLPMLPIQTLILNLLYDISQIAIPFDNVDAEFISKPQVWDSKDLRTFMLFFGPISSIFDILTFIILWNVFKANTIANSTLFQSGWFIESLITQILIVHMIRTRKIPFIQSIASVQLSLMTLLMMAIGIFLPMGSLAHYFKMVALPSNFFIWIAGIVLGYIVLTQCMKGVYARNFGWK